MIGDLWEWPLTCNVLKHDQNDDVDDRAEGCDNLGDDVDAVSLKTGSVAICQRDRNEGI